MRLLHIGKPGYYFLTSSGVPMRIRAANGMLSVAFATETDDHRREFELASQLLPLCDWAGFHEELAAQLHEADLGPEPKLKRILIPNDPSRVSQSSPSTWFTLKPGQSTKIRFL